MTSLTIANLKKKLFRHLLYPQCNNAPSTGFRIHSSLTARHLRFTIEAQMETDEIQALAKVDIQALDKR